MDVTLALLRGMAEQQDYFALRQACREQLMQEASRPVQILYALSCAHQDEHDYVRELLLKILSDVAIAPLSCSELEDLSAVYLALSDFELAENTLDALLQKEPANVLFLARKAYCRLMQKDYQLAYSGYAQLLELDSVKVEVKLNACWLLLGHLTGKYALSLSIKDQGVQRIWEILLQTEAQCHSMAETYTEDHYRQLACQFDAIRLELWALEGKFAEAEAWLNSHLKEVERYIENVHVFSDCLLHLGAVYLAEAVLLTATKYYPDEASLFSQLAMLASDQQRDRDAQFYIAQQSVRQSHDARPSYCGEIGNKPLPLINFELSNRIRARFTRDFISARAAFFDHSGVRWMDDVTPVFIIGVPFSGASLVEQRLLCSDQVSSLGISSHIPVIVEGLNSEQRKKGVNRLYPDMMDSLSLEQVNNLSQGLQSMYRAKSQGASVVIDKCVDNISHIGIIKCLLPNAKFIAVRRDPRSLLLSSGATEWLTQHAVLSVEECLGRQVIEFNALLGHWKKLFTDSILDITFESLTSQDTNTTTNLFNFIDVPMPLSMDDAMGGVALNYHEKALTSSPKHKQKCANLLRSMSKKVSLAADDMVTLPLPNMLALAYEHYIKGAYQKAEYDCKVILHYLPNFAPAYYLLGEIYLRNNLISMGVESLKEAIRLAPWKRQEWQTNLLKAETQLALTDAAQTERV